MAGLVDIAPAIEFVDVRGTEVEVHDVPVSAIGTILWRFPEVRKAFETGNLDAESLIMLSDDALAAIIAAATNISPGTVKNLVLQEKIEIVEKIKRVSMPRGVGPFVQTLVALMEAKAGAEQSVKAQASKSRKPSSS
jgi:hypothetical protein